MPVFGAVLTLSPDPGPREAVLQALADDPRITVGEACGPRLPIVLVTDRRREDHVVWDRLQDLDGVLEVAMALADFSDLVPPAEVSR